MKTRKELLLFCKENGIKGVSQKKKKELVTIVKNYNKKEFNRELFLKTIILSTVDTKDPITLEPFDEWTNEELQSGVLLNQYFYKEESIKNYICSMENDKEIYDPINRQLIDDSIVRKYRTVKHEQLSENQIHINSFITSYRTLYHTFLFYSIYIHIDSRDKIETKMTFDPIRGFLIGYLPLNINIFNEIQNPFDMKALDTKSTTDALFVRIINSYKLQKLISFENNKIVMKDLKNLPKTMKEWFTNNDGFEFIDTEPRVQNKYNQLLLELE